MQEIRRNATVVATPAEGGVLDVVSPDGQVVMEIPVPQGAHSVNQYLGLIEPGYALQVGKGCAAFPPRRGGVVSTHPLALHSDANPDFKPTSASRAERELRILMNEVRAERLSLQKEARERSAAKIDPGEVVPKAEPKDEGQVVEDGEAKA